MIQPDFEADALKLAIILDDYARFLRRLPAINEALDKMRIPPASTP